MNKTKIPNWPLGPFPVALVGAVVNQKPNFTTIGAWGCVCMEPVLYISLKNDHYSTGGVKENGFFSLNIPSSEMVQITDYCGIASGNTKDKSRLFTSFYDEVGKAPMIEECPINIQCEVIKNIPFFNFEMFFGKIVTMYSDPECLTSGKPDPLKINPLILLVNSYLNLGKSVGKIYNEGKKFKFTDK